MNIRKILANTGLLVLLASCSSIATVSSADTGPGLWLVPVNHTDRYAPHIFVEDAWAGNVGPQGGGGGAVCCIAGRKDWSKPALVKWRWGAEEDRVTKAITFSGEDHFATVSFPGAPNRVNKSIKDKWSPEDYMADEAYLCVIFRSVDKVEFAYSSNRGGCRQK
ncbi:MAG: DUF3304 domain-containing protein [Aquabacterium sp.]